MEYFTSYLVEYSLSVDNLLAFLVILSVFTVPDSSRQHVLGTGILLAWILRAIVIVTGTVLLTRFTWIYLLFAGMLLWAAAGILRRRDACEENQETRVIHYLRRFFRITSEYYHRRWIVKRHGTWWVTPSLVVTIAIGCTDVLFALDSIPAIFGLTTDPFLILTANAFALLGLRQLYFLLDHVLSRLPKLTSGLAALFVFIAVKQILHALHDYAVTPPWLQFDIWTSLAGIVILLIATVVGNFLKSRKSRPGP
jgi:tellurite resistance protein TerC